MDIPKGSDAAIVINRAWANLHGVRIFLRQNEDPSREIRGVDTSHIVFAKVLDSHDQRGLWVELNTERHRADASVERYSLLIPWNQVLTVVLTEEWSPAIREEARKIGFQGE
jgi:hypothetical protein